MRLSPVISIDPHNGKGKQCPRLLEGCQRRFLAPVQQGQAFGPPGGYIGERQGVQVAALDVGATMGAPVPLPGNRVGFRSTPRRCRWESAASGVFPLAW
jgi:hypothetical protein